MKQYYTPAHDRMGIIRIAQCEVAPLDSASELQPVPMFIVLFPADAFSVAKQFWQHTGDIISSRLAEYCLRILDQNESTTHSSVSPTSPTMEQPIKPKHGAGRYGRKSSVATTNEPTKQPISSANTTTTTINDDEKEQEDADQHFYVEERYGRNLPVEFSNRAKRALKRRIAGVLTEAEQINNNSNSGGGSTSSLATTTEQDLVQQRQRKGERGISGLSENDVYLFPTGMSAIYHAYRMTALVGDASRRSVCFG